MWRLRDASMKMMPPGASFRSFVSNGYRFSSQVRFSSVSRAPPPASSRSGLSRLLALGVVSSGLCLAVSPGKRADTSYLGTISSAEAATSNAHPKDIEKQSEPGTREHPSEGILWKPPPDLGTNTVGGWIFKMVAAEWFLYVHTQARVRPLDLHRGSAANTHTHTHTHTHKST